MAEAVVERVPVARPPLFPGFSALLFDYIWKYFEFEIAGARNRIKVNIVYTLIFGALNNLIYFLVLY